MANGIYRNISVGIAKETTFGTAAASPSFTLNVLDFSLEEKIEKAQNEAMLGSSYKVNDTKKTAKRCAITIKFKVDENSLPLLLLQNYTITSATAVGETAVYTHTCAYKTGSSTQSFTLFMQDPDRGGLQMAGFKFETMNIDFDKKGFVTAEVKGRSKYPATWASTNSLTATREFVGANTAISIANEGVSPVAFNLLSASLALEYGLSGEDEGTFLGAYEEAVMVNTAASFELEVSTLFSDTTIKTDWENDQKKAVAIQLQDTDRFVTGSTASTRPTVKLEFPSTSLIEWKRDGGANDLVKQSWKFLVLDKVALADTPAKITITNSVASY